MHSKECKTVGKHINTCDLLILISYKCLKTHLECLNCVPKNTHLCYFEESHHIERVWSVQELSPNYPQSVGIVSDIMNLTVN